MFERKKKFKFTAIILILAVVYGLYALYVLFAHNPSFELLSKNTISYSGLKAKIRSDKTKISFISVSLGTEDSSLYTIYTENDLNPFVQENYTIKYENKFFNSDINKKIRISIDFEPPSIKSVKTDSYIYIGGVGYVIYETSSDTFSSYVDSALTSNFDPITIVKDTGISNLVFFSCGNSPCKDGKIKIVAEDLSGNSLVYVHKMKTLRNKVWKSSDILIDLDFIKNKYNEIFESNIESVSVENFLELNLALRKENNLEILDNTRNITESKVTLGRFYQMKNSKVFSRFSEKRNYLFPSIENPLMTTYHWGYDLSSGENAKIYPSSEGRVSYVNEEGLGIYGKTIIIDHGLGFYSLYSHLSEINVEVGTIVSRSDVIGNTGQSGLAFGDHLHFGTYLQGVPFDSSEVWDNKYFRQKILTIYNNFIEKNSAKGINNSVKNKNYKK